MEKMIVFFFIETFGKKRQLLTPEEWHVHTHDSSLFSWKIFAADITGHFVTCLSCVVAEDSTCVTGINTLFVFNTTDSSYMNWPMLSYIFDIAFCP